MLKQGKCLFCTEETLVAPLESWDSKGRTNYYCQAHYFEVASFYEKQKNAFIDGYKEENTRKWLSPQGLELYNRLTQK